MTTFGDASSALLAVSGGDTIKVFDVSMDPSDPCVSSYCPSPGSQVHSIKWNITNLVVASAGDDRKISLWRKNGQNMGTVPPSGSDAGDGIDESILSINFCNKGGSRYLCSGGTGQVVRIWDLQRKRCIKWLKGHTDTISGVMYNCKDEHLASISLRGDLILHNLSSGTRVAELKDPNDQVLRVLDYSRLSRHALVTAGDDGSVHLWDTTGRTPKVSWMKQHSAPTAGVCFSPSNDKIVATVGLDKKFYTFDVGCRKPTSCVSYEAPFSSLTFRDDGWVLAAGTNNGCVVFYDVRGKLQPLTVLHAYSSSEAITSLCWQRLKPISVNENCTSDIALIGEAGEDTVLMPDPLPSLSSLSSSTLSSIITPGSRLPINSGYAFDGLLSKSYLAGEEETPQRNRLFPGTSLSRLHAPRTSYNFKDDMDVFSPLVDVQPITPSVNNWWNDKDEAKKDSMSTDKKSALSSSPSFTKFSEERKNDSHPMSEWKFDSTSKQDHINPSPPLGGVAIIPSKIKESSSATPPEAWDGEELSEKYSYETLPSYGQSRFSSIGSFTSSTLLSSSIYSGPSDSSSSSSMRNINVNSMTHAGPQGSNIEYPVSTSLMDSRKYSSYAERVGMGFSFGDVNTSLGSPKTKKTGAEKREEPMTNLPSKNEENEIPLLSRETTQQNQKGLSLKDENQGSSFMLQLVKRTMEETVETLQVSIEERMRNIHIEILRQFHMQEMETSNLLNSILEKQAELIKEVQALRKENQQLRQLL